MQFATVNTKRSDLKVYNDSIAIDSKQIGSVSAGVLVKVNQEKTVNGVVWANITTDNVSGWAIVQHPAMTYPYLKETSLMRRARNISSNVSFDSLEGFGGTAKSSTPIAVNRNIITESSDGITYSSEDTRGRMPGLNGANPTTRLTENAKHVSEVGGSRRGSMTSNPRHDPPELIQNNKGYPELMYYSSSKKRYEYDYTMDYSDKNLAKALKDFRRSINLEVIDVNALFNRYATSYNRFKVFTPDDTLTRTFHHVFFTRPDCNIIEYTGGKQYALSTQCQSIGDYALEFKNNPMLLAQLSENVGLDHSFMMFPSNKVRSFTCNDRTLETNTHGKNIRGYSIAYGKTIDESLGPNEVSMTFNDDRFLHLLKLHQIWLEYISNVRTGRFEPKEIHKYGKELDYAASAYYIVCDSTGENIIYWSKLYGIFPTNVPDSVMSMSEGTTITNPEVNITYKYSFKRDFRASTILEFNLCSNGPAKYLASYDRNLLSTGYTWVGAPFIEHIEIGGRSVYKLRFRPMGE